MLEVEIDGCLLVLLCHTVDYLVPGPTPNLCTADFMHIKR